LATQLATTDGAATLPALSAEAERFALRQRQARMFASSPLVPDHLRKGTPEQAMANCYIALTLAEAMGEVPLIVMQNIHVVSGKAGFAAQYMIARANSSGIFKGRIDWRIDRSDPKNLSVTAYAVLKDTGQEVSVTVDMAMARAEQWTKNPKYTTMPEVMLRYRSAAFLVRFYAPDVMLGYQTIEEVQDVVIAAEPAAPRLNASMLIEQAAGDPPTREEVAQQQGADPDTGELPREEDEETARQLDEQTFAQAEGRAEADHGDQNDGNRADEDSASERMMRSLIDRCEAGAKVDIPNIEADLIQQRDAMDDTQVKAVETAIAALKKRTR
jgi:hypothetical protein